MNYEERVDVLDLILDVLKDHEKSLDSLISKLGNNVNQKETPKITEESTYKPYRISLHNWFDFRDRCDKSDLVTFDISESKFCVSVNKNGFFYSFSEILPEITITMSRDGETVVIDEGKTESENTENHISNGKLKCGLSVKPRKKKINLSNGDIMHKINYYVDQEDAKNWLSAELKIDKNSIVLGEVVF